MPQKHMGRRKKKEDESMSNDEDIWNEIEDLEEMGKKKQANRLTKVYNLRFIEYQPKKFNKALKAYEEKYGSTGLDEVKERVRA